VKRKILVSEHVKSGFSGLTDVLVFLVFRFGDKWEILIRCGRLNRSTAVLHVGLIAYSVHGYLLTSHYC